MRWTQDGCCWSCTDWSRICRPVTSGIRAFAANSKATMERADFTEFLQLLHGPAHEFVGAGECTIARAPGRLDVMGGVADYSGGVVLEGTLAEAAFAAVRRRSDGQVRLWSWGVEDDDIYPRFETSLDRFYTSGRLITYDEARAHFAQNPRTHWAAYAAGALYVLLAEGVVGRLPGGADIFIRSTVPIGAGVSSSAAIEVASMAAVAGAYGISLDGLQLARLCQIVENRVAGAPCGIMDQVTSALGKENELLALLCQPHEVLGSHRLPAGCSLLAIDSGVKHSVGGSRYTRARTAAFMGLAILMKETGEDFGGYLCNITPREYRRSYRHLLPSKMSGDEFIKRYEKTPDTATQVQPGEVYSVRACAEHAVYENARVRRFIELLDAANSTGDTRPLEEAGRLMYASHWSYGHKIALGAWETDLIVRLARFARCSAGGRVFGAKITGGGSGGAVAVLALGDVGDVVQYICAEYERITGRTARVFRGSSPGTLEFGVRQVEVGG